MTKDDLKKSIREKQPDGLCGVATCPVCNKSICWKTPINGGEVELTPAGCTCGDVK